MESHEVKPSIEEIHAKAQRNEPLTPEETERLLDNPPKGSLAHRRKLAKDQKRKSEQW